MALKEENKNKKSKVWLFIIVLALFLINLLMLYKLIKNEGQLKETEQELVDTQDELQELDELKAELEMELAEYKGANASLDSIISVRDAEIANKVKELQRLLQKDGVTRSELKRAQSEISKLRDEINSMTMEIDSLSRENQYLKDENYIQKRQLEAKDTLIADFEDKNAQLSDKVKVGERIHLKSLSATPLREALIGDFKETDKLNKLEKIEISFVLANNDLAPKGEKTFYFKVQTPNKSTLVDPSAGSGTFNYQEGESTYTIKKTINFQNSNEKAVVTVNKIEGMTEGEYVVIMYSEDHEMGRITFVLR